MINNIKIQILNDYLFWQVQKADRQIGVENKRSLILRTSDSFLK